MKLALVAVGRLKAGPERDLAARYRTRADALARALGFSPLAVVELAESRARSDRERRTEEGSALRDRLKGMATIAFDERGDLPTSLAFAEAIAARRDAGEGSLAFVIGGPDGLDETIRAAASRAVSFGRLTLPHQLVRVLVLEQVYRALSILAGHPYHREG
ncbi:MAG: 23S rRNA (pseudouridine(1915)-N(3))-methyltransferase RlmH [Methylobacteriaceae bacterium]|nr:23S rRNA (pseudouridine(1915)-N(3))-methyltransferase RlmH [Methylobacteriaceae bacterium]